MVKVFALIPRRPDITDEVFHAHWAGIHAEVSVRIKTLLAYVQSHRVDPGVPGLADAPYEGIAEVWFTSVAIAAGMGEDPDYVNGAHADEPNFIDLDNLGFVLSEEHVAREGAAIGKDDGGIKAMLLLRRAASLDADALGARAGALGAEIARLLPDALRVSVATAVPEMYADGAEPAYDAIVELWFPAASVFADAWAAVGDDVLAALDGVADLGRSTSFLAEELRVLWPLKAAAAV